MTGSTAAQSQKICFIGYGSIIRTDDGLGPCITGRLSRRLGQHKNFRFTCAAQLDPAMAPELAEFDEIIFIDAAVDIDEEVRIDQIVPENHGIGFNTHHITFSQLMHLVRELYGSSPAWYMVRVRGYEFGFGEKLSVKGEHAAGCAVNAIIEHISGRFCDGFTYN